MPSPPTKTPLRNEYLGALASVNDQLCLTLFMHEDVAAHWQDLALHHPVEYTSAVFPGNKFADRIYVPMTRLVAFREAQLNASLGVSFSFAVEQLLLYIEAALRHLSDITGIQVAVIDPIDESLQKAFLTHKGTPNDQNVLRTVKYLRLRRNHVIHGASELSNEFSKLLKHNAVGLQKFWETRSSIPGLDFAKKQPTVFSSDETITLVKLARVCLEEIDACIATQLPPDLILQSIDAVLLGKRPELRQRNPTVVTRRIRKIRKNAGEMYGLRALPAEVASAIGESI